MWWRTDPSTRRLPTFRLCSVPSTASHSTSFPGRRARADDLNATKTGPPQFELWMRTPGVDPVLAPALAAYATDLTLIGTALRPLDSPTQSTARPRPLLRTGRHPHRKRQPGRLVRPGGPPAGADLTQGNHEKYVLLSRVYTSRKRIVPLTPARRGCQSL